MLRKGNRDRSTAGATLRLAGTAQALGYLATGVWPLVHMRSFEAVTGPKTDKWLVRTVSGLLISIGATQLRSLDSDSGLAAARRLGIGSAATLAAIDIIYASRGRISKIYLLDAIVELGILALWLTVRPGRKSGG